MTSPQPLAALAAALLAAGCAPAVRPAAEDRTPPTVRIVAPADGARVEGEALVVEVEYADAGSGVSTLGFRALLDGQDVSGLFDQHSRGATGRLPRMGPAALGLGQHRLVVEVADRAGHRARAETGFVDPGQGWLVLVTVVPHVGGEVSSLAVSPDGSRLAAGLAGGAIEVWDIRGAEARPVGTLTGHRREVLALTFAPDGRTLVSGGADRTVRLWELSGTPRERAVLAGHLFRVTSVAVSPDGRTLASASFDETIRLWDLAPRAPARPAVLTGHLGPVYAVGFSPDGRALASAGTDGTTRLWRLGGARPREAGSLPGSALAVKRLAFVGEEQLAVAGLDPAIRLVPLATPEASVLLTRHEAPILDIASAARQSLVSVDRAGGVALWVTSRATVQAVQTLGGRLTAASFAAGGSLLAAAFEGGRIYLCRVAPGAVASR